MEATTTQPESMMHAEPQEQHEWLRLLLGEWTYEAECEGMGGPDAPAETFKGTESVRSIGDLWILAEGRGQMPGGGEATTIMTVGYDLRRGRYIGTWVGSMMTHLWVYEGEMDPAGRVLTLNSDAPAFDAEGKMTDRQTKYKDVIEITSDNERTLTGYMLGEDGKWQRLMTARYRRNGQPPR